MQAPGIGVELLLGAEISWQAVMARSLAALLWLVSWVHSLTAHYSRHFPMRFSVNGASVVLGLALCLPGFAIAVVVPTLSPGKPPVPASMADGSPSLRRPGDTGWMSVLLGNSGTAYAQTSRVAWTDPYTSALESQANLVLRTTPLESTLTRIELAQWLVQSFDYAPNPQQLAPIADIEQNSTDYWTAQAVLQAGVMRAFEGDRFRPEGDITKLEAIAIFVRVMELQPPSDREIERWMALYGDRDAVPEIGHPFIAMAGESGLLVNHPDPALINPNVILTRGEGIVMLHQALAYAQQVSDLEPPVAQLAPEVLPRPEITAVVVTPREGVVTPGESLTVEVQGTPNAAGRIILGGSLEQPLVEVSPGNYRAVFIPSNQDFIAAPSIAIQLGLNGEVSRRQQIFPDLTLGSDFAATAPPPVPSNPNRSTNPNRPANPNRNTPPQLLTADHPTFTGINYGPQRNLGQGDILSVAIDAEPNSVASFDIEGIASNLPMREIRRGIYEGTYAIEGDDFATNPTLRVVVAKNGLSVQHREVLEFNINGSSVSNRGRNTNPPVVANNSTPNNRDNTQNNGHTHNPANDRDRLRNASPPDTVASNSGPPLIFSVESNAGNRALRPGDILEIRMRGEQQGNATFQIPSVLPAVGMQEVAPGIYEGQVRISRNTPAVRNGSLQVALVRGADTTVRSLPESIDINPTRR